MSALAMPAPRVFEGGIRASALLPTMHHMNMPASPESPSRRAQQSQEEGEPENLRSCQDRFEVVISAEKMQRRAALADIASNIEGQQIMVEETSQRQAQTEAAVAALRAEVRQLAQAVAAAGGGAVAAKSDQEQRQDLAELASSVQALHEEMSSFRDQARSQAALVEETNSKQMVESVMELGQGLQEIAQTVVATEQKLRREIEESAVALEASSREEAANTSNQILEALQQTTVQLADSLATEREGRKQEADALSARVDELCRSGLGAAAHAAPPSALPQEVEFLRSLVDEVRVDVTRLELTTKAPEGSGLDPQAESQLRRLAEQSTALEAKMEEVRGDLVALKEVGDVLLTDLQERAASAEAVLSSQSAAEGEAAGTAVASGDSGSARSGSAAALPTFCEAGHFASGPVEPAAQDADNPGTPRMVWSAPRRSIQPGAKGRASKEAKERSVSPPAERPAQSRRRLSPSPPGAEPARSSQATAGRTIPQVVPPRGTLSATCLLPGPSQRQGTSIRCTSPNATLRRQSPEAHTRSRASVPVDYGMRGGVATATASAVAMRSSTGSFVAPVQAPMMLAGRPSASYVAAPPAAVQVAGAQSGGGSAVMLGATNMAPVVPLQPSPHMHCR